MKYYAFVTFLLSCPVVPCPEACSVGKRPASLACILASTQQARLRNGVLKQNGDSDVVMSELLTAGPSMASVLEPLLSRHTA